MEEERNAKKRKKAYEAKSLLNDERFSALFKNPDFEVDATAEEYKWVYVIHLLIFFHIFINFCLLICSFQIIKSSFEKIR